MNEQEINMLRAEMLQAYSEIAAYNRVLYTVNSALLAYAINSDNYLLCLLPYCVMFPIHFMCETSTALFKWLHFLLMSPRLPFQRDQYHPGSISNDILLVPD